MSKHFTSAELADPYTGQLILQEGFGERLEALRVAYGHPMVVTSGCRSKAYNDWLKQRGYPASLNSFHLIGNPKYGTDCCAVDIARPNGQDMVVLMQAALASGWTVGIAKTFVHLDLRLEYTELPQIVYNYS